MANENCRLCHIPHAAEVLCVHAQAKAMQQLLERIATPTTCRGCPATIYMVRHKNGAIAPYTAAGISHFADCPAANQFSRKGE